MYIKRKLITGCILTLTLVATSATAFAAVNYDTSAQAGTVCQVRQMVCNGQNMDNCSICTEIANGTRTAYEYGDTYHDNGIYGNGSGYGHNYDGEGYSDYEHDSEYGHGNGYGHGHGHGHGGGHRAQRTDCVYQ